MSPRRLQLPSCSMLGTRWYPNRLKLRASCSRSKLQPLRRLRHWARRAGGGGRWGCRARSVATIASRSPPSSSSLSTCICPQVISLVGSSGS